MNKKLKFRQDFIELEQQFKKLDRNNCYDIPINEIQAMIANYNIIKKKYHSLIERGQKTNKK